MAYKKKDGKRPGVVLFYDWHESLEILAKNSGTAAVGNVILALLNYAEYGIIPDTLTDTEMMLFEIMRNRTDAAAEQYRKQCERNAQNGAKGGYTKAMNATTDPDKKQSYVAAITDPKRNPAAVTALLGDVLSRPLAERPQAAAYPDSWKVPIPKQGGGLGALTQAKVESLYRGMFPDLDLREAALAWAEYLNAAGEAAYPKCPEDAFEEWCRKYNQM